MNNTIFNADEIIHEILKTAAMGLSADEALDRIIEHIGNALHADRCYIFEQVADNIGKTFEWAMLGTTPLFANERNYSTAELDDWYQHFIDGENVILSDVEEIRYTKPSVYNTLKAQNTKSIVLTPLIDSDEFIGFYGLHNPPAEHLTQIAEILGTLSFFIVSELRRKKKTAHEHNKLLDAMHTTGVFVITESDHKILYFNNKIKQIAPHIKIGSICHEVWKDSCSDCPLQFIKDKKSHTCVNCDTQFGVPVDITATKYMWQNRIPAYIIQISPHEDSLNEHEARIRGMYIDVMNDMFFKSVLVDLDTGNYESFYVASHSSAFSSRGVYDDLVKSQASIIDTSYRDTILKNCSFQTLKDYFEKGNRKYECVYRTNRTDGFTWLKCIAGLCPNTYSEKKYMIVMIENVTEAKEKEIAAERALQTALRQAQAANIAKTTFLSNMSHDIRTPMNAILGYASIAASSINDSECVDDCLGKILSSGEHLQGIINDILDMSRIESGKVTVNPNKASVSKLIRNSLHIVQTQLQNKQQKLVVNTVDIRNEIVWMDITKMQQVLVNILGNAVKFTGIGGEITFTIIQKDSPRKGYAEYIFKIKDNGIGIRRDFMNRIFDAFEQGHASALANTEGTGLGMTISKKLIDLMGGTIGAESEEGKGCEFTVRIELKIEENMNAYKQLEHLKGSKVLVLYDDSQACESIAHMLRKVGIHADLAANAKEALSRTRAAFDSGESYYAYILDLSVPDMNGFETTRSIRDIAGDNAPIIILKEYYWEDIEKAAREAGATAFCTKPVFVSDIAKSLLKNTEESSEESKTFDGESVLLVEDNELNAEIAVYILKEMGFKVQIAENGRIALNILSSCNENEFQYVLMDIQMPDMNGYEATRRIRALDREYTRKIPIIAVTANAFKEDADECYKSGMNAHLAKPFKKEDLSAILTKFKSSK